MVIDAMSKQKVDPLLIAGFFITLSLIGFFALWAVLQPRLVARYAWTAYPLDENRFELACLGNTVITFGEKQLWYFILRQGATDVKNCKATLDTPTSWLGDLIEDCEMAGNMGTCSDPQKHPLFRGE
ncbi:MAG: hypothetical protein AAGC54_20000, partial [Cyanobacteria bacterium P01_F01_bin.4]